MRFVEQDGEIYVSATDVAKALQNICVVGTVEAVKSGDDRLKQQALGMTDLSGMLIDAFAFIQQDPDQARAVARRIRGDEGVTEPTANTGLYL